LGVARKDRGRLDGRGGGFSVDARSTSAINMSLVVVHTNRRKFLQLFFFGKENSMSTATISKKLERLTFFDYIIDLSGQTQNEYCEKLPTSNSTLHENAPRNEWFLDPRTVNQISSTPWERGDV